MESTVAGRVGEAECLSSTWSQDTGSDGGLDEAGAGEIIDGEGRLGMVDASCSIDSSGGLGIVGTLHDVDGGRGLGAVGAEGGNAGDETNCNVFTLATNSSCLVPSTTHDSNANHNQRSANSIHTTS